MSLSIGSGSAVPGVPLAMFRGDPAGARRREDGGPHRHDAHHAHDTTPLATAMADALRTLGWTPPASTTAAPAAPTAVAEEPAAPAAPTASPDDDEAAADLPAALADFAEALMAALREAGGGRGRGRDRDGDGLRENGDNGRRAWGYGRAVGVIAVRLERVIGELKAALPAPSPAAQPAPADPVPAASAPAAAPPSDAAATPADPAAPVTPPPADPVEATPTAAAPAPDAAATDPTTAAEPAPAPATSPLADAFAQLLAALRDNGAALPADGDPAAQMVAFLQALAAGLKPADGGGTVTGLFIRISV